MSVTSPVTVVWSSWLMPLSIQYWRRPGPSGPSVLGSGFRRIRCGCRSRSGRHRLQPVEQLQGQVTAGLHRLVIGAFDVERRVAALQAEMSGSGRRRRRTMARTARTTTRTAGRWRGRSARVVHHGAGTTGRRGRLHPGLGRSGEWGAGRRQRRPHPGRSGWGWRWGCLCQRPACQDRKGHSRHAKVSS